MSVERRDSCRFVLRGREKTLDRRTLVLPVRRILPRGKHLGDAAPAHVAHQHALFFVGGGPCFLIQPLAQLDSRKVVASLLLERSDADAGLRLCPEAEVGSV